MGRPPGYGHGVEGRDRPTARLDAGAATQLRLLRNLGLVIGTRSGRSIVYSRYDNHVTQLLDEAIYHSEHLRLGLSDRADNAG